MTSTKVRHLYNLVPGFKNDKDEDWACYLPTKDQMFLRKSRNHYLVMMDRLDGLKLELKDNSGDSQQSKELASKIKDLTTQIDNYIQTLLIPIPTLKRKGLEIREKRIEEDLRLGAMSEQNTSRTEPSLDDESEALDNFGAFMPRTDFYEPYTSAHEPEPESTTEDQEQFNPVQEATDTYMDGVEPENIEIMEKLRRHERYKCRDSILEALRRLRHRSERLETIESFKELEKQRRKVVVPMDQSE